MSKSIFLNNGRIRIIWKFVLFLLIFQVLGFVLLRLLIPLTNDEDFYLTFSVNLVVAIATFFSLHIYVKWIDKSSFHGFGLNIDASFADQFLKGIGISVAVIGLYLLGNLQRVYIILDPGMSFSGYTYWGALLGQLVRYLSGSFFEEVLSTAFLFLIVVESFKRTNFSYPRRKMVGIAVSALVFGLLHGFNPNATVVGVLNLVLFGALTTSTFARTGSLGFAIAFHASWNFIQNVVLGLPNSGKEAKVWVFRTTMDSSEWASGGAFGLEGSLIATIGLLLLIYLNNRKIFKKS